MQEVEIINERFSRTKQELLSLINIYCTIILFDTPPSFFEQNPKALFDISISRHVELIYHGIRIELNFAWLGNRVDWWGATFLDSPWGRHEHYFGYIQIDQVYINKDHPVDLQIVAGWEPFFDFFRGLANFIRNPNNSNLSRAQQEIFSFKSLVERQIFPDIYVDRNPQENIARALLQVYLRGRSYREVPVKRGRSDLTVYKNGDRFLYETKIWNGPKYYEQGLRELGEYISGEADDGKLVGIFYLVFDPTKSQRAASYLGEYQTTIKVQNWNVDVFIININPEQPSKKQSG